MRKWALITALAAYAEANGRHDANGNVIEGLAAEELARSNGALCACAGYFTQEGPFGIQY